MCRVIQCMGGGVSYLADYAISPLKKRGFDKKRGWKLGVEVRGRVLEEEATGSLAQVFLSHHTGWVDVLGFSQN